MPNKLTDRDETFVVYNQFVSGEMRHPTQHLKVGFWSLKLETLNALPTVVGSEFFGDINKYGAVEFYFPLDLSDEYPGLIQSLGQPDEVLEGILNPSGRSIWIFSKKRNPVCLKIDTMQLFNRKFFSERVLLVGGVIHSIVVTNYLSNDLYNCSEDRGGNIFFNHNYSDGVQKRYTYLLREYDFEKLRINRDDVLIPVVSLLSKDFWSNPELLKNLQISKNAVDFVKDDFARCMAVLIKNSLTTTFLHFEIHQQNLSLHLQNGNAVKLIYHDLQDSVFDTITYFINACNRTDLNEIETHYVYASQFQKNYTLNSHGHLLTHTRATREYFTVVSLYRRYLRNFGAYNKALNYFMNPEEDNGEYFSEKTFESQVLKYLNFKPEDLHLEEVNFSNAAEKDFLSKNLFWMINRFHQYKQKKLLNDFKELASTKINRTELDPKSFQDMIKVSTTLYSNGFPINVDFIDFNAVTRLVSLFEDRVLLITYKSEEFLILRFY